MNHGMLYCRRHCCYVFVAKRLKMGWKKFLLLLLFTAATIGIFLYLSPQWHCASGACVTRTVENSFTGARIFPTPSKFYVSQHNRFLDHELTHVYNVDFEKDDVIVFLHVQKTGGTSFGKHLVKHMELETPCKCHKKKKRCDCFSKHNTIWLFSRYSTGWICGLHADWTELHVCVEEAMNKKESMTRNRKYHYITILRDPVKRLLSEWKHVQRGATWKTSKLFCNGRRATHNEVVPCFNGSDWSGVTLEEFLNCKDNLAHNRQTRMLANLTKINCYNTTGIDGDKRDQIMLESAKENLLNMAYFGLTEFQLYTQKLFEYTFHKKFNTNFSQLSLTHSDRTPITEAQKAKIADYIKLDIDLYEFAKDLFLQRVQQMKKYLKDYSNLDYEPVKDGDYADIDDDEADEGYV